MREGLIDRMLRLYGEESVLYKEFVKLCQRYDDTEWNNKVLEILVLAHEASPVSDDSDWEEQTNA